MDFSHLYISRPQKSVDEDAADIIAKFRELFKAKKTGVRLINYHQGLPLSFPATIVGVEHGLLDLDIHPQQAVAIERDRYTFLKCDAFAFSIGARVQNVNIFKRAATLTRFFFADVMAEQRHALRLTLNPTTDAAFEIPEGTVTGKLYDLSVGGATVLTDQPVNIPSGTDVKLQFLLPNIIQNTHIIT